MTMFLKYIFVIFLNVVLINSHEEGSQCPNFDGSTGICRVQTKCKWALDGLKNKQFTVRQLVQCGFQNRNVIICCKEDIPPPPVDLVMQTTTKKHQPGDIVYTDDDDLQTIPKVPRKAVQACDKIKKMNFLGIDFHILNGNRTEVGEFPHQVVLGYKDELDSSKDPSWDCGGSLISRNFVLTAAHCANSKQRQPKVILLGKTSLDNADELDATVIDVKVVHLHPQYTSRLKYNDIALIEMNTPPTFEFSRTLRPACLYTKSTLLNEQAIITGFGIIEVQTRQKSTWMMKAFLRELPLDECRAKYLPTGLSKIPDNLRITQMCATGATPDGSSIDACQGDSGGPLQIKETVLADPFYTIVGVTSFGASCGSSIPGVYTRVSEYLDWIEQVVWPRAKVEI
ncbi:serine protease persephone-like [Chironomus tepperi]|uniref:serine protease persephone-like n=1 Tax=Chironomus tepperi TaxID=113505 RepID=UPI00391F9E43